MSEQRNYPVRRNTHENTDRRRGQYAPAAPYFPAPGETEAVARLRGHDYRVPTRGSAQYHEDVPPSPSPEQIWQARAHARRLDRPVTYARTRKEIAKLSPLIRPAARRMVNDIENETGVRTLIYSGARTNAEQDALFAKGPHVTRARGGLSDHNYGLGFDIVPLLDNKNNDADWKGTSTVSWPEMAAYGKKHGFNWGGDFKDFYDGVHFYQTGPLKPRDLERLTTQDTKAEKALGINVLGGDGVGVTISSPWLRRVRERISPQQQGQ